MTVVLCGPMRACLGFALVHGGTRSLTDMVLRCPVSLPVRLILNASAEEQLLRETDVLWDGST